MAERFSHSMKIWRTRIIISLAFSPIILLANEVLNPTSAYAEEGGASDNSPTEEPSTDNASEEVVLEASPTESAQDSIGELATAVATAESDIQNVEQELQETKNLEATIEATPETTEAIANAESGVASASDDVASASAAVESAQTALSEWETAITESDTADAAEAVAQEEHDVAETNLNNATADVAAQELVVADKEEVKDVAQAEYDAAASSSSETVMESFEDEGGALTVSSTDIEITVDGAPVTTSGGNRVTSSYDKSLYLNGYAETEISVPDNKLATEIGFDVYAKNGDLTAYANLFDSSGATSTESFVVQHNVSPDYPNYTHTEIYYSPSGYHISSIVLPLDRDIYILDNIYYVVAGAPLDPTYQQNLDEATANYTTAVSDLTTLQTEKDSAQTIFTQALDTLVSAVASAIFAQEAEDAAAENFTTTLASAQTLIATAETSVASVSALVSTASSVIQTEAQAQKTPPPPPSEPSTSEQVTETPTPLPTKQPEKVQSQPEPQKPTTLEPKLPEQPEPKKELSPEPPPVLENPNASIEEKVEAIIENIEKGEAVDAQVLIDNGITFDDLPPETPVEVREDSNGNPVVIDAQTAAALSVLESPGELAKAVFENPEKVVDAVLSIGKDMSEEEREESQEIVVASVVVANVANLASNAAAAGGAVVYRRKP